MISKLTDETRNSIGTAKFAEPVRHVEIDKRDSKRDYVSIYHTPLVDFKAYSRGLNEKQTQFFRIC